MGRVRKGRDIDAALCKKGFRRDTDGKHIQYFFVGSSEIRTMMSHGDMGETIGANLLNGSPTSAHQSSVSRPHRLHALGGGLSRNSQNAGLVRVTSPAFAVNLAFSKIKSLQFPATLVVTFCNLFYLLCIQRVTICNKVGNGSFKAIFRLLGFGSCRKRQPGFLHFRPDS